MLEENISRWLTRSQLDSGRHAVLDAPVPFAIGTDIGLNRKENQDRAAAIWVDGGKVIKRAFLCVAVCDGMGGMKDGATSATTALSSFFAALVHYRRMPVPSRLRLAAETANRAVHDKVRGGGATLSAAIIENGSVYLTNVGDSRIYAAVRSGERTILKRMTTDDSMKEALGAEGEGLLQYIGMGGGLQPHIQEPPSSFNSLLITSDGAHTVGDEILEKVFLGADAPSTAVERLTTLPRWVGGTDNATVAVIAINAGRCPTSYSKDAEIVVWSPFGQLQIAWTMAPPPMPSDNMSSATKPTEKASSENKKKPRKRKPRSKKKTSDQREGDKVQFDIGFEQPLDTSDDADS